MEDIYYNGTKILNTLDLDGNKPEIYLVTSNRNAGKTTYFGRYFMNRFINYGEKFVLLRRYNYELSHIGVNFFSGLKQLFFSEYDMVSKPRAKGKYHELFLKYKDGDPESCGYAITLNDSNNIRLLSSAFSDATKILFDEFQTETNSYCNDEIIRFISVHTSLARGGGAQVKYLPVFMLSNHNTLLNPYYVTLGISERLQEDTKFLRGHGFVLEQSINENASKLLQGSAFARAFEGNKYIAYASENVYLHDEKSLLAKVEGSARYLATVRFDGKEFAVRKFDSGIYYCDSRVDKTFKFRVSVTADDLSANYQLLPSIDFFVLELRHAFMHGMFRFSDLTAKKAMLKFLSF